MAYCKHCKCDVMVSAIDRCIYCHKDIEWGAKPKIKKESDDCLNYSAKAKVGEPA
jgi:hypothetical protein